MESSVGSLALFLDACNQLRSLAEFEGRKQESGHVVFCYLSCGVTLDYCCYVISGVLFCFILKILSITLLTSISRFLKF